MDLKLIFVRTSSQLYRFHLDMTIKKNEEYDKKGKLITSLEVLDLKQKLGNKGRGSRSILMYLDDANKTEGL